ncbi:MAG: hypothetical protein ABIU29_05265 [Chthoniobacterales bacterium]
MKNTTAYFILAVTAALLALASPGRAGILTLDEGSPTFTPPDNFSDNTIVANTVVGGGLIELKGTTTITPNEGESSTIRVTGTFSAAAGERFSVAYKFVGDLAVGAAAIYTLQGSVSGIPIAPIAGTFEPGLHVYEGAAQSPPFPFGVGGNFEGSLTITFAPNAAPLAPTPNSLDLTVQQIDFQLDTEPASVQEPAQSQNISTRANVGTGDNVLIGGIIITGNDTKQVVLRGIGPSLSTVPGALDDPVLELYDIDGMLIATNDDWMDNSAEDQTILTDNNLAPAEDAESALVANLDPGAYTAIVRGAGDTTGVALVEAYDLDNGSTDSKLANISTRGFVESGDDVMIGGFILGAGGGLAQVIVRGIGPSLADQGISDLLADPEILVFDGDGNLTAANDDWMDDPNMQTVADNGLAPSDPDEAALYLVLAPGAYTVILRGVEQSTGVGLVESYNIDGTMAVAK